MRSFRKTSSCLASILLFAATASPAFPQVPGEPRLIRDTDVAEGKNDSAVKEPNPVLAAQNVNIGNYYLKQRNYSAAIQRFREAIEYQADLIPAYEGLAQAYEKNGQISKAVETYKGFLEKYPDSPQVRQFRSRLAKLESRIK